MFLKFILGAKCQVLTNTESFLFSHPIYQLATSTMNSNFVNECFICLNMQIINFSVTKATLQLQMSICLSVSLSVSLSVCLSVCHKKPSASQIHAYQPNLSLSKLI